LPLAPLALLAAGLSAAAAGGCSSESGDGVTTVGGGTSSAAGGGGATSTGTPTGEVGAGGTSTGSVPTGGGTATGGTGAGGAPSLEGECDDWAALHPEWLWCDDFETEQDLTVNYDDYGLNGLEVSNADPLAGSYSLRQHYTTGQVDAGWISKFYGDTLGGDYGPIQDHFYMRWFHKFEAGFSGAPPKMARLTSIGPGWDKRLGVYYWIDQFEIVADVSTPDGWLPLQHSGFFYSDPANIGRWTCHEMYVKANTPGLADGAYRYWVDGQQVIDVSGVSLVGNNDYHFNNAMLDCYWNDGSPAEQNRYYDNFVISSAPIGCGAD
jgi:hypothetical protein